MTIDRLRAALLAGGAAAEGIASYRGDWEVTSDAGPEDAARVLTPAAVLIALTAEAEPQLLLTKRTSTMTRHPGQIAFPGGRVDPEDDSAITAALREAEEEVSLARGQVDVLGTLERYETGTGFSILPVVGVVPTGIEYVAHAREVDEIFHVPFAHVMNPANHELRTGEWLGKARKFYVIRHGEREIWGATAGILVNLSRRLG
ncbi:coenzyme A pyrophosphatase [Polymorphobacter glacialis]|uniref:Coenzyme A pyrophosphatase n=1 Tax=Sandarakinorhabdus glacialis TaxID=1614636 RepID=A0A917E479_9SPHN|nr:CoA pyrophosphatase [Polymorphobacter glacialis]GGE01446.1 coenzyme A pyrophosphatase [Polymorphobacter glacialis]